MLSIEIFRLYFLIKKWTEIYVIIIFFLSQERSVLQAKLTKLAIQIGYGGSFIAALTVIILIVRFSIVTFAIEKKAWDAYYIQ